MPDGFIRLGTNTDGIFSGHRPPREWSWHPYLTEFNARGETEFEMGPLFVPDLGVDDLAKHLCIEIQDGELSSAQINGLIPLPQPPCEILPNPRIPTTLLTDPRAVLHYNSQTGNLRVDVSDPDAEGAGALLTTLEIVSANKIFTGDPAQHITSWVDVDTDGKIFKFNPSGFHDVDFGNVVATGLSNAEFVADVCVAGSWYGGGAVLAEYQYPGADIVPIHCSNARLSTDIDLRMANDTKKFTIESSADPMTTLELRSKSGVFTGTPENADEFAVFNRFHILKQDRNGFSQIDLGTLIDPTLSQSFLADDLSFDITTISGATMGNISIQVPEPRSAVLVLAISLGLMIGRQRRLRSGSSRR
ncbi:MAG: hypothetical protein R3C28_08420 [Pirellulaceae bacterium]